MKVRTCICGGVIFHLTKTEVVEVDYGHRGGIDERPFVSQGKTIKATIRCAKCLTNVPEMVATEMMKEII